MNKLMILMVMLLLVATAASAQIASPSKIVVKLVNQIPDPVAPGGSADVRFKIENNGSENAPNVELRLPDRFPFTTVEPGNGIKQLGSIQGQQTGDVGVIARFTVKVSENAADGTGVLRPEYRIDKGPWTAVGDFSIEVQSRDAILAVESVAMTPDPLLPGQLGTVAVVVKNLADSTLRDVRVQLDLKSSDPFTPIGGTSQKVIPQIASGAEQRVQFTLMPDADALSKVYKVALLLNYQDDIGASYSRNNTIGLLVATAPELHFALEDTTVHTANANGNVVVSISNTGPSNIKFLTVQLLEQPQYQVLSVPAVYVGNLESDDFETAEFSIHTLKDSEGTLPLAFLLSYKDDFNKNIEVTQDVPLRIYSKSDARKFGLVAGGVNPAFLFLTFGVQIIALVFIAFMLIDAAKNPMPRYKKALWMVLILTVIGAALYYFMARRKTR